MYLVENDSLKLHPIIGPGVTVPTEVVVNPPSILDSIPNHSSVVSSS